MIRVHCHPDYESDPAAWPYLSEDTTYHDFETATAAAVTPNGSLILTRVEVRQVSNPANLSETRTEISNPQLVAILPEGMWGPVEPFDDDGQSES